MLKEEVHVAVPTAFFEDESLDVRGTINHIKNLFRQGIKSVLVCGTTGEQHSLNLQEKINLVNGLVLEESLLADMEILFGVASVRQKEAEILAEKISTTALSGVVLGYPPYIIPTQEEAIAYSKSIIHLSNKPVILYNNPKRTGFDLSASSITALSHADAVIGIKNAGSTETVERIKNDITKKDFYFYAGGEIDLEEKISCGYNRLSSMAGNIAPVEISRWFHKKLADDEITDEEKKKFKAVTNQVFQGNAVVNIKELLYDQGVPLGSCRSPVGNMDERFTSPE